MSHIHQKLPIKLAKGVAEASTPPEITEQELTGLNLTNYKSRTGFAGWFFRKGRGKLGRAGLLSLMLLSLFSTVALASIPGSGGVITGCYLSKSDEKEKEDKKEKDNSGGQLRVIDLATSKCNKNETQLSWNQTGPQGPIGLTGPQGPKGDTGPQGLKGATGPKGDTGPAGKDGAPGKDGAVGPTGPKGDTGAAGPKGEKGDMGPQGIPGLQGPAGPAGLDGAPGKDGAIGPQGPKGEKGETGAPGPQGATGPVGPQGPIGLTGPTGPKGDTGATGPAGVDGAPGKDGAVGPQGPKGDTGPAGPQGPKGDSGPAGPQGPKGDSGLNLLRTIVVSPKGSASENGAALLAAMRIIAEANPSATNPWLLKLEPGNYDLGNNALILQPYVDLDGSGEDTTTVSSTVVNATSALTQGTLMMAANSEARFVKIANTGTGNFNAAVYAGSNVTNATINHLTASASNSDRGYALFNDGGTLTVLNSTLGASGSTDGYGLRNYGSKASVKIESSNLSGSGQYGNGLSNKDGAVSVLNSNLRAWGNLYSYGLYSEGGTPYNPVIVQGSTLTGTGSSSDYSSGFGLYNSTGSTLNVIHSLLTGTGYEGYGLYTFDRGVTTIESSVLTAYGNTNAAGVYNNGSNATTKVQHSTSSANALNAYGLLNNQGSLNVQNSILTGNGNGWEGYGIHSTNGGTVKVGASQLSGTDGLVRGIAVCANSYSLNFVPLNSVCAPSGDFIRTVVVSPKGSTSENGIALLAAMKTITEANPSATNPWLLKLEPGNYDLGNKSLSLQPYVDLEGSGEDTTTITSAVVTDTFVTQGTLMMAANSEARFIKIVNTGTGYFNVAVYAGSNVTNATINHLTAVASGSDSGYGLLNEGGELKVVGSNFNGYGIYEGIGISNEGSTATIKVQNSTTGGFGNYGYGLISNGGTTTVQSSNLYGSGSSDSYAIYNKSSKVVKVGASQLSGSTTGTARCVASYNADFVALNSSCS
jgi:hypothetical protein